MGTLNKILNGFIKFAFILTGLAIAVVPLIYIWGHEATGQQPWRAELERFSGRAAQLDQSATSNLLNVYLTPEKGKLNWADVNATIQLADFLHHHLQKQGLPVVRRLLEFKKPALPKKTKTAEQPEPTELGESNEIKEVPPLQWLKNLVEPYIGFEHQSLRRKHWVIVCLGELDSTVAREIESILKSNKQYRAILVSPWPITTKLLELTPLPYDGPSQRPVESQPPAEQPTQKEPKGKDMKEGKEAKPKKEPKIKVKVVKEAKIEAETPKKSNGTADL